MGQENKTILRRYEIEGYFEGAMGYWVNEDGPTCFFAAHERIDRLRILWKQRAEVRELLKDESLETVVIDRSGLAEKGDMT